MGTAELLAAAELLGGNNIPPAQLGRLLASEQALASYGKPQPPMPEVD